MIAMKTFLFQVSGEEGKGGQASATPRLPGVSPVVPRVQGGQPPPMQVEEEEQYWAIEPKLQWLEVSQN